MNTNKNRIIITLATCIIVHTNYVNAQTQSEPRFDLFKSFRRLTNTSLVNIEKLIDEKKFNEAINLTIKTSNDLNNTDKVEIIKTLRPSANKIVENVIAELAAIKPGISINELNSSSADILKKHEKAIDLREIILFFDLKETITSTMNAKVKDWLEVVEKFIRDDGHNIELTKSLNNFPKIVSNAEEPAYNFCHGLINSAGGKEIKIYSFCEKFLTLDYAKKIRNLGLDRALERTTKVNGALEKIEYLNLITTQWNIQAHEWGKAVLPMIPPIKILQSNDISNWLDSRDGDFGVYLEQKSPSQSVVREKKTSRFKSGESTVINPQYLEAERNYQRKLLGYQNCETNYQIEKLKSPYAMYFCGFDWAAVDREQRVLSNTNRVQTLSQFSSYDIDVSIVQASNNYTAHYYIYSQKAGRYVYKQMHKKNLKEFRFADGINPNDQDVVRSQFAKELDIKEHIEEIPKILLAKEFLIEIVNAHDVGTQQIIVSKSTELEPNKRRLDEVTNKNIASPSLNNTATINKFLNNSVVVINGKTSLGAGFFVMNKFVVTNDHVVEGASMVEIETKDGRKTTGLVIFSDAGLDLALIATTFEGQAIELQQENPTIGEDVFALGHPGGLKFSASRGIISAIRNIKTLNGKGLMARYIQSDVAINPGNSGGPLIVNGKVVGINTFRRAEPGSVGLGFALSSVEIRKWINEKLPRQVN